jgi:tRNA(fMet)-specific endonuclease VapC
MKPQYLLDTDAFSLMVKGQDAAINTRLQTLAKGEATLSVITAGEFYYGVAHAPISALRDQRAQRLLDFFGVMALDPRVAVHYGALRADLRRAGTPIGPNDLWLAAQALAYDMVLVTRNTREFARVGTLKITDWSQP